MKTVLLACLVFVFALAARADGLADFTDSH